MHRSVIESLQAPKAIGPYSQAIAVPAARTVFLSGQIPLDPATGELARSCVPECAGRIEYARQPFPIEQFR